MTMPTMTSMASMLKEEQANSDTIWKQVLDPVLEYIQVCVNILPLFVSGLSSLLDPDIRQVRPRPNTSSDTSPHHDSPHGGRRQRGGKPILSSSSHIRLWSSPADVACLPKSYDRACRSSQETC